MVKRRRKTSRGATVTYYWRRTVDGRDQRMDGTEDGTARVFSGGEVRN